MSKTTYYFSHDSNARNDSKIIAVRMKHGVAGYGCYFMLLERLMEASDYKCPIDYSVIAFDLRAPEEIIRSVVEDFGLFEFSEDRREFFSPSLINRLQPLEEIREKRRQAGVKSAEARRIKATLKQTSTHVQSKVNTCSAHAEHSLSTSEFLLPSDSAERESKESKVIREKEESFPASPGTAIKDNLEKKNEKKGVPRKTLFRDSPAFEIEYLKAELNKSERYAGADAEYYHQALLNWSDAGAKKMVDWVATARSWINRDREKKSITLKPQNDKKLNGIAYSGGWS